MRSLTGNTVLITGGGSGIGFGLAKRFVAKGNKVIISGRRKEQLERAQSQIPSLEVLVGDVASEAGRIQLVGDVLKKFPSVNVLVNNAGIQNRAAPFHKEPEWEPLKQEIAINFEAPVHLSILMLPHLVKLKEAAIINITSGLAFVPIAGLATYSATKAAMHSFTASLRHQLKDTSVAVIEAAPPAVNTDLGGKGLHTFGIPLDEYCDFAFSKLESGETEFGFQFSEQARVGTFEDRAKLFKNLNSH